MNKITIWRTPKCWVATFHEDEKIVDLFGTDTLPLPFLACASPAEVKAEIQAKNPMAIIEVVSQARP